MAKRAFLALGCALALMTMLIAPTIAQDTVVADLDAIKDYTIENGEIIQEATANYVEAAQRYYAIIEASGFDYEAAWSSNQAELAGLIAYAKAEWLIASIHYELDEGIVAGVPSLAYYDVWLDAGPTGADSPDEALEWSLELPDGTVLENPGNFFHHLTEPALWGTNADYVGLAVDLDGDGEIAANEVLPEANIFLGAAQGLDVATTEMNEAILNWEPTLEDAFTAMAVMTPTMSEYFEQWKESVFIAENSEEQSFVAVSRLLDISGILNGLNLAYDQVGPLVAVQSPDLHAQIDIGFNQLVHYVGELYEQEQSGSVFTAEEADLLGAEAQSQAESLAALIAEAADLLQLTLELE
jgi:hypothetical protein